MAVIVVLLAIASLAVYHGALPTVKAFNEVGSITLNSGENGLHSAVIDEANQLAYFGTVSGTVVKIDLATLTEVGSLALSPPNDLTSAVIDSANHMVYFAATAGGGAVSIVKVDLATFSEVGSIDTSPCPVVNGYSAVIDPVNHFAYFGGSGAVVVKVDLTTFAAVGCITLSQSPRTLLSAVIDSASHFAYFGTDTPPTIVKVDLTTFTEAGFITLNQGVVGGLLNSAVSAVIDPSNHFAYFGTAGGYLGYNYIVKVDLNTFTETGSIALTAGYEYPTRSAVIDPVRHYAYFGINFAGVGNPAGVVKVDLTSFRRVAEMTLNPGEVSLSSAVIDPENAYAYFGTDTQPGKIEKVDVSLVRMTNTLTVKVTTTATTTATTTVTPVAGTSLSILALPATTRGGDKVTFTILLSGSYHELRGPVSGKQISVSAFGTSAVCTTNSLGFCLVTLTSPKTPGSYLVTAQFAGDAFFAPGSTSLTTKVK